LHSADEVAAEWTEDIRLVNALNNNKTLHDRRDIQTVKVRAALPQRFCSVEEENPRKSYELRFYVPLNTKQVTSDTFCKPISCLDVEKQNHTQQKHAFTNQNKHTTQNKHKKNVGQCLT